MSRFTRLPPGGQTLFEIVAQKLCLADRFRRDEPFERDQPARITGPISADSNP